MSEEIKQNYEAPKAEESTIVSNELMTTMQEALNKATETINTLRQNYNEEHDRYIRVLADYQNLQRNSAIKISTSKDSGRSLVLKDLIPIIDNFEYAINANEVSEGVVLIYNGLKSLLVEHNVETINPAEGDPFDEYNYEAIAAIPGTKEQKNKVAFTQFKGYKMGEMMLRHAKVGVYVNNEE